MARSAKYVLQELGDGTRFLLYSDATIELHFGERLDATLYRLLWAADCRFDVDFCNRATSGLCACHGSDAAESGSGGLVALAADAE